MRLAVIGCGSWGATVARRARSIEGVELVALVDTDHDTRRALGDELGVESGGVDWIGGTLSLQRPTHAVVATPPGSGRLQTVRELIAAGVRHLRIEKPVAIDPAEARQLLALCNAAGVKATVGHTPLNDEAVNVISETIGGWEAVTSSSIRVGSRRPAHDVSVMHDLLVHDAALALMLFGTVEVQSVTDEGDHASMTLEGPGVVARLRALWSPTDTALRHTIFSRTGSAEWLEYDELGGTLTLNGKTVWARERDPLGIEIERWRDGGAFPLRFGVEVCELIGPAKTVQVVTA